MNYDCRPKWADTDTFIELADDELLLEKWSPDVVIGFTKTHDLFDSSIIPCTMTVYGRIDKGNMRTKNMDLFEKLSRKPKDASYRGRTNKLILGQSIEHRPVEIDDRQTFGHWEIDTFVENKVKIDSILLMLVERQTRFEIILKLKGKDKESVDHALSQISQAQCSRMQQWMNDYLRKILGYQTPHACFGFAKALLSMSQVA